MIYLNIPTSFNKFQYTSNKDAIIDVELAGVDPKGVKLTYSPEEGRVYVNGYFVGTVNSKYYDFSQSKAELRNGLLKVTVPQKQPERVEIPLTIG